MSRHGLPWRGAFEDCNPADLAHIGTVSQGACCRVLRLSRWAGWWLMFEPPPECSRDNETDMVTTFERHDPHKSGIDFLPRSLVDLYVLWLECWGRLR